MGHSSPRSFCLPQRTGLRNTGNNLSFAMCTGLAFQSCLAENPSNIHFIEQMGGLDGMLKGTSLHLSTSFSTGAVFSDTFLDSLLATSFYNYHVVELLQMLVTGGISSEMEHYLVKEKPYKTTDDYEAIKSGRTRCKLGLLSLDQTVLSGINPRKTFGQLFCGSLDNFGILCVGLYRMIDEEEPSQEHKRGV